MKALLKRILGVHQDVVPKHGLGKSNLLSFGDHTYGLETITIHAWNDLEQVKIGKYCSIGENLVVILGGGHDTSRVSTFPFSSDFHSGKLIGDSPGHPVNTNGVEISNDVWIGMNVTIMGGVRIGNGAVIAANSHVVRDVLDYEVVGGNPAMKIRDRFSPEIKEKLLELRWWDQEESWIIQNKFLLISKCDTKKIEDLFRKVSESDPA